MDCLKCITPLRSGSKYCHFCGLRIEPSSHGYWYCWLFEDQQRRVYKLLPNQLQKFGTVVPKGPDHVIRQYYWQFNHISKVFASLFECGITFLRIELLMTLPNAEKQLGGWTHIKPNPRKASESWNGYISRSYLEIRSLIHEFMQFFHEYEWPVSVMDGPIGIISFCDEFLYEHWTKYRETFKHEFNQELPCYGSNWHIDPISIDDVKSIWEPDFEGRAPVIWIKQDNWELVTGTVKSGK